MNDAAIERPDSPPPFDALLPQPLFPSFIFTIFPRGGYVNKCVRLGDNRRRWKKGGRVRGGSAGPLTSDANRLQAIVAEREEGVNGLIYRSPRLTNFFCCLPRWEANGRGARIAAARQSECVANTMHISHCSWPNPFLRKGKNDSAKHCSRLPSWVHQVQSGHVLAWLQSKQNWPFLRLYLPLILLHLFFLPGVSTASSPVEAAYFSVTQ